MAEFYIPTPDEMRDQFLEDFELGALDEGLDDPPIEPGTDWYGLAVAEANLHAISLQNLKLAAEDVTPLTAQEPKLDEWRKALGLPEVTASAAVGKLRVETTGSASLSDGEPLTYSNGTRYKIVGTYLTVQNNDELDCQAIDLGTKGNRLPGDVLNFVNPPTNVKRAAYVSDSSPITDGTDKESPEAKRERILNRTANAPSGGNWGYLVEKAHEASPAVQDVYVYPALGGPSSVKVVLTQAYNPSIRDYTRSPTDAVVKLVRDHLQALMADGVECITQAVADEYVDVSLEIDIPDSILEGGDGTGWVDSVPWPDLYGSDTKVAVTTVTSSKVIVVNASSVTSPTAGQTHIAWWNPVDQQFETRLVTVKSGSAGAWTLTLDAPLVASDGTVVAVGDWICPASVNMSNYGKTFSASMEVLGPGENTSDANRLPRSARHPIASGSAPIGLTKSMLKTLLNEHEEILDIEYSYRSATTPTVPTTVQQAPNVLVLRRFACYQM